MLPFKPEQFDIAGVFAFIIVIVIALAGLLHGGNIPRWMLLVLLVVGVLGLIVDVIIVFTRVL